MSKVGLAKDVQLQMSEYRLVSIDYVKKIIDLVGKIVIIAVKFVVMKVAATSSVASGRDRLSARVSHQET